MNASRGLNKQSDLTLKFDRKKKLSRSAPGPKYLLMNRINENATMRDTSPFLVKRAIDTACSGEVDEYKMLQNGSLRIKTKNLSQAQRLITLVAINETIKIEVKEQSILHKLKGVVHSDHLRDISEDEMLTELKSQHVIGVDKIKKKNGDELQETGIVVLTFSSRCLPNWLNIGYAKIKVKPYIPVPLLCKNCFKFNHLTKFCRNKKRCFNCGNEYHLDDDETCLNSVKCINCFENNLPSYHNVMEKTCPIFIKNMDIQTIRVVEKVDKKTARLLYNQRQESSQDSTIGNNTESSTSTATQIPCAHKNKHADENNKPGDEKCTGETTIKRNNLPNSSTITVANSIPGGQGGKIKLLPRNASKRMKSVLKAKNSKKNTKD